MKELFLRNGLTIDRLRAIYELYTHGTLIKAARGDDTRASQYSRQIAELEKFFEFSLVRQNGRTKVLTDEGIYLAETTIDYFSNLLELLHRGQGKDQTYRIGAGESLLQWIVIPGISVLSNNSEICFRLSNLQNSQIVKGLLDRSLDFGLLRKESLKDPLEAEPLGTVHYVLSVPTALMISHNLDDRDWKTVITRLPIALHQESTYIQGELEAALESLSIKPRVRLRFDTFPSAMAALRSGRYATLMIQFPGVEPAFEDVITVPLPCLDHTFRDIYLAWLPRTMQRRADAENVKNALIERLKWTVDD